MEEKEMVNHPEHYQAGNLECIEVMLRTLGRDITLGFCLGNSFKYQWRCNMKGKHKEDLQKAKWYLNKYLEILENNEQSTV